MSGLFRSSRATEKAIVAPVARDSDGPRIRGQRAIADTAPSCAALLPAVDYASPTGWRGAMAESRHDALPCSWGGASAGQGGRSPFDTFILFLLCNRQHNGRLRSIRSWPRVFAYRSDGGSVALGRAALIVFTFSSCGAALVLQKICCRLRPEDHPARLQGNENFKPSPALLAGKCLVVRRRSHRADDFGIWIAAPAHRRWLDARTGLFRRCFRPPACDGCRLPRFESSDSCLLQFRTSIAATKIPAFQFLHFLASHGYHSIASGWSRRGYAPW